MKVLMYDLLGTSPDDWQVTETITDVHECRGDHDACEGPVICEDCGHEATPDRPVYVWTVADGFTFWSCESCLDGDDYCELVKDE